MLASHPRLSRPPLPPPRHLPQLGGFPLQHLKSQLPLQPAASLVHNNLTKPSASRHPPSPPRPCRRPPPRLLVRAAAQRPSRPSPPVLQVLSRVQSSSSSSSRRSPQQRRPLPSTRRHSLLPSPHSPPPPPPSAARVKHSLWSWRERRFRPKLQGETSRHWTRSSAPCLKTRVLHLPHWIPAPIAAPLHPQELPPLLRAQWCLLQTYPSYQEGRGLWVRQPLQDKGLLQQNMPVLLHLSPGLRHYPLGLNNLLCPLVTLYRHYLGLINIPKTIWMPS